MNHTVGSRLRESHGMEDEREQEVREGDGLVQPPEAQNPYLTEEALWKAREDELPQQLAVPAVLFVALIVLCASLVIVSRSDTAEANQNRDSSLAVEQEMVFFHLDSIDSETFIMNISAYITNYGDVRSGDIVVNVYAEDISNDIVYETTTSTMPAIPAFRTAEALLPLDLPDNRSFRLRILLFESGQLQISGYGEVYLGDVEESNLTHSDPPETNQKLYMSDSGAGKWLWDLPGLQYDESSAQSMGEGSGGEDSAAIAGGTEYSCLLPILIMVTIASIAGVVGAIRLSKKQALERKYGKRGRQP